MGVVLGAPVTSGADRVVVPGAVVASGARSVDVVLGVSIISAADRVDVVSGAAVTSETN